MGWIDPNNANRGRPQLLGKSLITNDFPLASEPSIRQTPGMPPKPQLRCDVRASFALAFRAWRLNEKIPLKRVAKELGVALATVHAWELGERFPTGYNFEQLVAYTGLPPCRLLCVMAEECFPIPTDCKLSLRAIPSRKARKQAAPADVSRCSARSPDWGAATEGPVAVPADALRCSARSPAPA
jgi:transcriptional regulator with XRE-family HTH domain